MKNKYRFISLIITLCSSLLMSYVRYNTDGSISINMTLWMTLAYGILFWILGGHYDKLKYLAEKDPLTDTYNRRFVDDIISNRLYNAKVYHKRLSVAIMDINKFKAINDTYGHERGDVVLKEIANILRKSTRKEDVLARWGGDEFLLLTSDLNIPASKALVRRIGEEIEGFSEKKGMDITISIGVAHYPQDGKTLDDLIRTADRRMFDEKQRYQQRVSVV